MQRSNILIGLLAVLMILQSCASAEKLVETGNYDQAIDLAIRKLAGKKNKKTKYVLALEEAFARAVERDMRKADILKNDAQARPENWDAVNDIYQRIDRRQNALRPLLPLIDQEGIKANFKFVRVEGLLQESRDKAAAFHYENGRQLLEFARSGDKSAARQAYTAFNNTREYFPGAYRDRNSLQNLAEQLGVVYVKVNVDTDAPVILPQGFANRLEQISVRDLDSRWRRFHTNPQSDLVYDYQVNMRINDIQISPELVREREYTDTREIEDGWEYVLDENGNVAKDTAGNDIKAPRIVLVKAWVLELHQYKEANVEASVELIDLRSRQVLDVQTVTAQAIFENYASTFRGDERALSQDSRRCIGKQPLPFPDDGILLLEAADRLKPILLNKVSRTNRLI